MNAIFWGGSHHGSPPRKSTALLVSRPPSFASENDLDPSRHLSPVGDRRRWEIVGRYSVRCHGDGCELPSPASSEMILLALLFLDLGESLVFVSTPGGEGGKFSGMQLGCFSAVGGAKEGDEGLLSRSWRFKTFDRSVCYEDVGCFSTREGAMKHLRILPSHPKEIGTEFILFDTRKGKAEKSLPLTGTKLGGEGSLNVSLPTAVLIHGYMDNGRTSWAVDIKDALLGKGEMNVISVNWERGASHRNYVMPAANSELVGRQVGNLVAALVDMGATYSSVHIIGFSLGAQVAGHAANWLKEIRNAQGGQGAIEPLGHVDFYPNGGESQPGCRNLFIGAILDLITRTDGRNCNHRRAHHYFLESLRRPGCSFRSFPCPELKDFNKDFLAGKCFDCGEQGCGNMGWDSQKAPGRGKQYLLTLGELRTQTQGFCGYQYKISLSKIPGERDPREVSIEFQTSAGKLGSVTLQGSSEETEWNRVVIVDEKAAKAETEAEAGYNVKVTWIESGFLPGRSKLWRFQRLSITDQYGLRHESCGEEQILQFDKPLELEVRRRCGET
ncbi:unnamed protein product [Darwinula stevensoni]|uniref:Lipase domain-containing protein n=1 Tax=Darwinula stevensoni TaxID=69355 RepID=A0A7R9AAX8_9CRUS|nr:unnamed protein product [Darwinula stevensoni]CAG0898709.1 unnamed protein product [Darwinula stevensoni]